MHFSLQVIILLIFSQPCHYSFIRLIRSLQIFLNMHFITHPFTHFYLVRQGICDPLLHSVLLVTWLLPDLSLFCLLLTEVLLSQTLGVCHLFWQLGTKFNWSSWKGLTAYTVLATTWSTELYLTRYHQHIILLPKVYSEVSNSLRSWQCNAEEGTFEWP